MELLIYTTPEVANQSAATVLRDWLISPGVHNVMLAAGGTPLDLYQQIARQGLSLAKLNIFALDEYVGVPVDEPRNCGNLIRHTAVEPWGVPIKHYFTVSSLEADALTSVQAHEQRINDAGGLDLLVLGLGQNGHLGFNEPGSAEHSTGRVVDLDTISIEANRKWFKGDYAPYRGATVGMNTILSARRVLLVAYGAHKTAAAKAMVDGPRTEKCPASLLQGHPNLKIVLDETAAAGLERRK
jgi:glucosamine-6-phosphate deaminase